MTNIKTQKESGLTGIEFIVSFVLLTLLLSGALLSFREVTSRASDNEIIFATEVEAREILHRVASELRGTGAGMPLGQCNFRPNDPQLGLVALPVLLTSSHTQLSFRYNPKGRDTFLTETFTPQPSANRVNVEDSSHFAIGDSVYISNASVGGSDGLYAVITSISENTIGFADTVRSSKGASFSAGSILTVSEWVTYDASQVDRAIHRFNRNHDLVVSKNASFRAYYRTASGKLLNVPLSERDIDAQLAAIEIHVMVDAQRELSDGSTHTASVRQLVNLRNLNFARHGRQCRSDLEEHRHAAIVEE